MGSTHTLEMGVGSCAGGCTALKIAVGYYTTHRVALPVGWCVIRTLRLGAGRGTRLADPRMMILYRLDESWCLGRRAVGVLDQRGGGSEEELLGQNAELPADGAILGIVVRRVVEAAEMDGQH
jgi:hypothetical protein